MNWQLPARPLLASLAILIGLGMFFPANSLALQDGARWVVLPFKVVKEVPHTEDVLVEENGFETKTRRVYKPVWRTEQRQRRVVTKKPVVETRERLEKKTYYRPEQVTRYREREVTDTVYRKVTKYRDETYTVRKPVVRTEYRNETRTVRKPVTESMVEVTKTTSYRPVTETRTELVAKPGGVGFFVQPNAYQRPRLRYLPPGYYTDPVTGLTVYRRRGIHWTTPNPTAVAADLPPTLVAEDRTETRYVPETREERRPVDVTRLVDSTETYRVPYEVETMVESTATRQVPYTVEEPVKVTRVEKVPYTETIMKEEVVTRRVPYQETVMKEEVTYEPYDIVVGDWEEKEIEEQVPTTRTRKVTRETTKLIEKVVNMKVLIDKDGNYLTKPVPLNEDDLLEGQLVTPDAADEAPALDGTQPNVGEGTTDGQQAADETYRSRVSLQRVPYSVLVPSKADIDATMKPIGKQAPVAVPTEKNDAEMAPAKKPEVAPSKESGDENAAD